MYLDYFGFDEPPFSITPDPKFIFLSEKHQDSLAHLIYGITRGGGAGFVQLTGEVGTGKTTISRLMLEQIPLEVDIALILNPTLTPIELLENISKELKISIRGIKGKRNELIDKLNEHLLKSWSAGKTTVVMIDEAQNLPRDTLEQLRLLTNLETDKQKLLQIILIGQPELRSTLRRNDLRQLAQRVTARYHLLPLSAKETLSYIHHRIEIAGGQATIVSNAVCQRVYKLTQGIPRLINVLVDRALLAAYTDDSPSLSTKHIKTAAHEVLPLEIEQRSQHKTTLINTGFVTVIGFLLLFLALNYWSLIPFSNKQNQTITLHPLDTKATNTEESYQAPNSTIAWHHFYQLWDSPLSKNWQKPLCPKTSDTGMACLRRQGNLSQIKKINHPALLHLSDNRLILLTSTNDDKIGVLNNEGQTTSLSIEWLNERWLGTYFMVWPMPAEILLTPSKQQMHKWSLEMANTISPNNIDENQLDQWIIQFQQQNGLLADGIIGSETQMALSLNAYNGPTLSQK